MPWGATTPPRPLWREPCGRSGSWAWRFCSPAGPAEIGAWPGKLGHTAPPPGVEIAPASQVIEMEDNPARAFKDKPDASMTVGLRLLKEGRGEAFVSAGSTGALLSAATLLIKRIRGIRRGGPGPVVPNAGGNMVLIDCGATAEAPRSTCSSSPLWALTTPGGFWASRTPGWAC